MSDLAGSGARFWRLGIVFVLIVAVMPIGRVAAAPPANSYFERTWARTDRPVLDQEVNRTWMWGPVGFTGELQEPFQESPGGVRRVQCFDKSRMEISDTGESMDSIWYVTNGLLVVEMMTGRLQTGMNRWETRQPANISVAGDANDPLGATYRYFGFLRDLPAKQVGAAINEIVSPGSASNLFMYNDRFLTYGATAAYFVPETGHTVASPFWNFMNSSGLVYDSGGTFNDALFVNPFYATGYPVTEAYWAVVKVGGLDTDVLIQCFERRCLTYTPSNSAGWQVEAGNVGRHYFEWRNGAFTQVPPGPSPVPNPPIDTLPPMILSLPYEYPESAVHGYLTENGYSTSGSFAAYLYGRARTLPGTYSMITAPIGTFNHDTRLFSGWLYDYLSSSTENNSEHLCGQVQIGLYEPESNIARRLRQFELASEPDGSGSEAWVYYYFLIGPVLDSGALSPGRQQAARIEFEDLMSEYFRLISWGYHADGFAEYASKLGYLPPPCD